MKNPRVGRRKEILKIRAERNAKETKETIAKINKAKSWFFEHISKQGNKQKNLISALFNFDMVSFVSFAFISPLNLRFPPSTNPGVLHFFLF